MDAETAGLAGVDVDGGGRSGDGEGREEGCEESDELHFGSSLVVVRIVVLKLWRVVVKMMRKDK